MAAIIIITLFVAAVVSTGLAKRAELRGYWRPAAASRPRQVEATPFFTADTIFMIGAVLAALWWWLG
jgi:hypothetical protein